jgi:signal transduction histidine kinase/methylmalonyl-CoA mutase cobalamin-binding subunit
VANAALLQLVAALASAGDRADAARRLAEALGAKNLLIFIRDPAVEALLPAPGFPQTLRQTGQWQAFLAACAEQREWRGELLHPDEPTPLPSICLSGAGGAVLVLLGGSPFLEQARDVALLLPLLDAAFSAERIARDAASQESLARQSAKQAQLLAASLDRARQTLRKALGEAEAANKAKDEFLAALSHELRTPLNPVLMTATAMESDTSLTPEVRSQASIIRRNTELEARLIDDLLDLTRITHGKLKLITGNVDVHRLLDETQHIILAEGGTKQVTIEIHKAAAVAHVIADSTRLQQALWNLIKNALKFTPAGGKVSISTANPAPGRLAVRVSDTGIGIAPEILPHIFKAFEQGQAGAQPRFGGLGLGLAIARAVVELHAGRIIAESAGLGCGATFTVELQTACEAAPLPEERVVSTAPLLPLRVLLVEDHDSTREVLARILRRWGHEVHVTASAEQALEVAATVLPLDVAISDLGLPGLTGFELMRRLKSRYGLRGIALSGYGMDDDLKQAREAGFEAHLIKPVSLEQLQLLLQKLGPRRAL